jgi:hypothetical protein
LLPLAWKGRGRCGSIRDEGSKLLALKKKQLVKLASILQVWVTHMINGASRQISKPMMVRRLVAAKFGASVEQASTPSRKGQSKKKHKPLQMNPLQMRLYTAD